MNENNMVIDARLNIVSTITLIAMLKLVIFPVIVKKLGNAQYGLMITVLNVLNKLTLSSFEKFLKQNVYY